MKSPCKNCDKRNLPKCIDSCEKISDFQKGLIGKIHYSTINDSFITEHNFNNPKHGGRE